METKTLLKISIHCILNDLDKQLEDVKKQRLQLKSFKQRAILSVLIKELEEKLTKF